MNAAPTPNPTTVEALLETAWRLTDGEQARTAGLDGKAAHLATFASLVLSITATLGTGFLERFENAIAYSAYLGGLAGLVAAVAFAVRALLPKEHLALGMAYIATFPSWSQILKSPTQVHGEVLAGLVEAVAHERNLNSRKALDIRRAFICLLFGLVVVALEASILGAEEVFG